MKNETWKLIEKEGKDFNIVPMIGIRGNVLAAESIPTKLKIQDDLFVIEDVSLDICEVNEEYPMSAVFNNRIDKEGRKKALSQEIYQLEINEKANEKEELKRDMIDYYQFAAGAKRSYGPLP